MREVTVNKFIELVKNRVITHDEKVSMYSSELLDLVKEKLNLESSLEDSKVETDRLKSENLRLRKQINENSERIEYMQNRIDYLTDCEKIQRKRAFKLQEQLNDSYMSDGAYTVRYLT